MAMENPMILESCRDTNGRSVALCGDESVLPSSSVKESENLDLHILEDLDLYLEDIDGQLTISRMVSDSVIRGMVNAVEEDAAEKIAEKELEVARLKKTLHLYHFRAAENDSVGSPVMHYQPKSAKHGMNSSFSDALAENDGIRESLSSLKSEVKEQLKKLKKDIDRIRGSSSVRRISSGSELVGLSGILQDKVSEKWMDVDKTFDSLRTTLDTVYKRVDDMVYMSKAVLCQWQQEWDFQGEIEDMVMKNCIRSLQEEFEERLWDQNAQFYGNESVNWLEKIKEISSLRQELDAISKSFSAPETAPLTSHGSLEIGEEWSNNKKCDHLHRKVSGNHVSSSALSWEGNGKHEESVPENLDVAPLKHMSKDELVNYFKTEMTKMKRNHDYKVQEITEELFTLKREYLKEKGSSLPLRKDKEFDVLRKKIPEVILKLDNILVENQKFQAFSNNAESLSSLKDRLESLLSENRQLRDLLTDKKKEVKCLSSQVSDAAEKMSQNFLAESNLLKEIGNLKCAIQDAQIEASISEDVYKCLLREAMIQTKCIVEESAMEYDIMQEIYEVVFREASRNSEPTSNCEFEDSDMESILMQGMCGVIFRETFKEAEEKFSDLNMKYINENKIRVSLETETLEKARALRLEVAEKERLENETLLLEALMDEKEILAQEAAAALLKEKAQFELVAQELHDLKDQISQQEILISERSEESNIVRANLAEALERIELSNVEMCELKQKLELEMKRLKEADEEKMVLLAVTQEKQNALSLVETKEREHRKQMELIIVLVHGLSKAVTDFECRVTQDIKRSNLRLENLSSQWRALIQKANILKRTGLTYKQRLERRCSDLQKAEAEVDLLGDEVETLLSLLEKIYIALDHYSPILQHYPGIIEVLKLVRRELSGESTKPV